MPSFSKVTWMESLHLLISYSSFSSFKLVMRETILLNTLLVKMNISLSNQFRCRLLNGLIQQSLWKSWTSSFLACFQFLHTDYLLLVCEACKPPSVPSYCFLAASPLFQTRLCDGEAEILSTTFQHCHLAPGFWQLTLARVAPMDSRLREANACITAVNKQVLVQNAGLQRIPLILTKCTIGQDT